MVRVLEEDPELGRYLSERAMAVARSAAWEHAVAVATMPTARMLLAIRIPVMVALLFSLR